MRIWRGRRGSLGGGRVLRWGSGGGGRGKGRGEGKILRLWKCGWECAYKVVTPINKREKARTKEPFSQSQITNPIQPL